MCPQISQTRLMRRASSWTAWWLMSGTGLDISNK